MNKLSEGLRDSLQKRFCSSCDFITRCVSRPDGTKIFVASIFTFCDKKYISEAIIRPIMMTPDVSDITSLITTANLFTITDENEAASALLEGSAVIFFQKSDSLLIYKTEAKVDASRSVSEPEAEVVIRGPREGFVENAVTNIMLLRKRLKIEELVVEKLTLGKLTKTEVFVVYLSSRAEKGTVDELKARLRNTDLPSVIDSGYLEHFLSDEKHPLFPDVGNSEKPDKVAAKLAGGRIAVICDGSPCVLTVPYFFVESIQSSEDYLKTSYYATFIRIIRMMGLILAIFLPAVYVALTHFDSSAIPHSLYVTIAKSREGIPFTPFTELVYILVLFEIIREVGLRMPRAVGSAVSIVAGIILGDAAIKAGIASAPVIMVAAVSATCSFIDPPIMNALPIVRLAALVVSRVFGLFGVALSFLVMMTCLVTKTSFGKPYLMPYAPIGKKGMTDILLVDPASAISDSESEVK